MEELIRKETISEELGVSLATVNNWIKTRVIPSPDFQNCYSKIVFEQIIGAIKNSQKRLNSRANRNLLEKKTLCYSGITNKERKKLLSNLVKDFETSNFSVNEGLLALSLAILRSNKLIDAQCHANGKSKLDVMLSDWLLQTKNQDAVKSLFEKYEIQNFDDDILGAFYQSIQSISQKSFSGTYYTPSKLLTDIKIPLEKTVLDPCCGSGGILLNILSKDHDPSKIFARDIDDAALKICFINLVLFFNDKNIAPNISKHDITLSSLETHNCNQFDYIVTNPPWGSKFTILQKEALIKLYPELSTSEIFSIALYNAHKMLKENGQIYFFLPYSFLNVAAHKNIRQYIFKDNNKVFINLLGNSFKGVLSEGILLHLIKSSSNQDILIKNKNGNIYNLPLQNINPPDYIISATGKRQDALILDKIYSTEHTTLFDAAFALGIVTGNNKKYLLKEKTKISKPIFRGKDIEKYVLSKPIYYLDFKPELFQQTAPEEYYRQEKIVYRFISGKLICALDKDGNLLLNSANLFISNNYPMETIVSFFNSDIYTFIFKKKFHSRKVLKSHLKSLPLPILSNETHQYIKKLYYETFSEKTGEISLYQNKIDKIICSAFLIDDEEYSYIKGNI
ncbi:MAG: N-6 DNA methylase [Treponema sp.]|nr:N-6 DNA methylase [Treponema sp.]MCL2250623.1 N-6 DNA methylase [Treponema sp.]